MTMKTALSRTSQHAARPPVGGAFGIPGARARPASPLGGAGRASMAVIAVDDNVPSAHHFAAIGRLTEFVQEMLPP